MAEGDRAAQAADPRDFRELSPERLTGIRNSLREAALTNILLTLAGGTYLTAFALLMGAQPVHIGLIASLPALANLLQVVGSYLVQRTGSRKRVTLICFWGSYLMRLLLLPLPWLVFGLRFQGLWILIAVLAVSHILASLAGAAWLSWLTDLVPARLRGRFLGRRSIIAGSAGMAASLLSGHYLDLWNSAYVDPFQRSLGIAILFSIGILAGMWGLTWLHSIPDQTLPRTAKPAFWSSIREPLRDRSFVAFLTFSFMWTAMVGLSTPFFAVHMIQYLALPFSVIAALHIVSGVANILGLRLWGPMTDEAGAKPFLRLCCLTAGTLPYLWLLARPDSYAILWPLHVLIGLAWAGIGLTTSALLMNMAPAENNAVYFAVFAAVTGISGALAPMAGGLAGNLLQGVRVTVGGLVLEGLHFIFITSATGRILVALLLLGRVVVPEDLKVSEALRKVAQAQRQGLLLGTRRAAGLGWAAMESTGAAVARGMVASKRVATRLNQGSLVKALSRNASRWEIGLLRAVRWVDRSLDRGVMALLRLLPFQWPEDRGPGAPLP